MSEIYVSDFGEILKEARKDKGITQKSIADRLSISKATYSLYESGKRFPTPEKAIVIAEILDLSLDELFTIPISLRFESDRISETIHDEIILRGIRQLNNTGKEKAVKYIDDLTKIPEYRQDSDQDHDQE